jgi:predicted house-cleaning NTP pyrophosphatase (Maf/HAM1 superfamily)
VFVVEKEKSFAEGIVDADSTVVMDGCCMNKKESEINNNKVMLMRFSHDEGFIHHLKEWCRKTREKQQKGRERFQASFPC